MRAASLEALRARYLPTLEKILHETADSAGPLAEMIRYHYASGGKRLRALTVLWAAGANAEAAVPFAAAVETVHNATLLHDDLQDGDEKRRGQPTVWKKFSSAQAINCGDILFFAAIRLVSSAGYDDALARRLVRLLAEKAIAVIAGQGEEFALKERLQRERAIASRAEYEAMVTGKTAALFSLPLVGGAWIAGVPEAETAALERGAALLGLAFQINDDFIDLWGEKGREAPGSDIAEGKLSYPALVGLESLATTDKAAQARLLAILAAPRTATSAADVAWAIATLEHAGAKEACRARLAEIRATIARLPSWGSRLSELFASF